MSNRNKYLFISSCMVLAPTMMSAAGHEEQSRPNIVVIMSDDMGYSDLSCYGGVIQTPNLDRLAKEGLKYLQFYNGARSCPSRSSLVTGLFPHQTGIGDMTKDVGLPGYRGDLNHNCMTFGEVFEYGGYETYMFGKWHLTKHIRYNTPNYNWPLQRGFQHFYGTIIGAGSYYDPLSLCRDNTLITPENDPVYQPEKFYYTDAIADNVLMELDKRENSKTMDDRPFFMYVAFTAAHWPMQAPEKDIAPYRGKFDAGWDELRKVKYENLRKLGMLKPEWKLSDSEADSWASVKDKKFETECMEVYAGIVSALDRNVGKIISKLEEVGELENTLIIFLEDNGACAENYGRSPIVKNVSAPDDAKYGPMGKDELQDYMIPYRTRDGRLVQEGIGLRDIGDDDDYVSYGGGWAAASNSPFRFFKHWAHEGGISTPLIIRWGNGIKKTGEMRSQPGQLMDIMATCIDVAGIEYPKVYKGHEILPLEGKSLVPTFEKDMPFYDRELYFEHHGNRAVRKGKWKLVCESEIGDIPLDTWELYDMEADRTETNNLAKEYPNIVKKMAKKWDNWAERTGVKPWPFRKK